MVMESNGNNDSSLNISQNHELGCAGDNDNHSRRNSFASSQTSSPNVVSNNDSGNVSDLSEQLLRTSISSVDDDPWSPIGYESQNALHRLLREKDQLLVLSLHDVRKQKSELERLSKSEKWYKTELKAQKSSRMEILERLYTNERKYAAEKQRLQTEFVSLNSRCADYETQLIEKRNLIDKLQQERRAEEAADKSNAHLTKDNDFKLEQNLHKIADQDRLIGILRDQKRTLLQDIQKLTSEKDETILQLQKNIAVLEDENQMITKKTMRLCAAKAALEDQLQDHESRCHQLSNELVDFRITIKELQEKIHLQITEMNRKDQEINDLKQILKEKNNSEDTIKSVQMQYERDVLEKNNLISSLNETVDSLNATLNAMDKLQTPPESQSQIPPNRQNTETPIEASVTSSEEHHQELLNQKLLQTTKKYLEICKLYERLRFDSDMKDITVQKLNFENGKHLREIANLREKIINASKRFELQKSLATEFEFAVSRSKQEQRRLEEQNKSNFEVGIKLKRRLNQIEEMLQEKEMEVPNLNHQLSESNDILSNIRSENSELLSRAKEATKKQANLTERLLCLTSEKLSNLSQEQHEWQGLLDLLSYKDQFTQEFDQSAEDFDDLNHLFDKENANLAELNKKCFYETSLLGDVLRNAEQKNARLIKELEHANSKISDLESQVVILKSLCSQRHENITDKNSTAPHGVRPREEICPDLQNCRDVESKLRDKQISDGKKVECLINENKVLRQDLDQLHQVISQLKCSDTVLGDKHLIHTEGDAQSLKFKTDDYKMATENACQWNIGITEFKFSKPSEEDTLINDRIICNVRKSEHQYGIYRSKGQLRTLFPSIKYYEALIKARDHRSKSKQLKLRCLNQREIAEKHRLRNQVALNQKQILDLQQQLAGTRSFIPTGAAKQKSEALTNLMDDYKQLIQQSSIPASRYLDSELYELINRSNKFVPNLRSVCNQVDGLRHDIQQLCATITDPASASRFGSRKMSLLEELRLAESDMCP